MFKRLNEVWEELKKPIIESDYTDMSYSEPEDDLQLLHVSSEGIDED